MPRLPAEFFDAVKALGVGETPRILWVSVPEQRLRLFVSRILAAEYPVSTAKNGIGCRRDSFQTPVGLHQIARKIGEGQPLGMIFRERKPTTVWKSEIRPRSFSGQQMATGLGNGGKSGAKSEGNPNRQSDLILTRILWLEGLQPGVNRGGDVDTFSRHIYIHGTNQEDFIGQPASHGCVRMRNTDVVALFAVVTEGDHIWIR